MKTSDLFKINRKAHRLNESLEKTFGKKINFEAFDLEKLQDARNKLRTQISQVRGESGFNENLENEALTQAQWMLDAINAEIEEREEFIADAGTAEASYEEGFGTMEQQVQKLLDRFEQNAMERGAYGNVDTEAVVSLIAQGDYEGAAEEVWNSYSDQDGGEVPQIEAMIEDLQDDFEALGDSDSDPDEGGETDDNYAMASAGFGSDEDYESVQYEDRMDEKAVSKAQQQAAGIALAARRKGETPSGKGAAAEMSKMSMKELEKFAGTKHKNLPAKKDESIQTELSTNTLKSYQDKAGKDIVNTMTSGDYMTTDKSSKKVANRMKGSERANSKIDNKNESINTGEDMRNLKEGEIQQAQSIVTAKTMVDRVGRWIEELSGMENDTLLQLGDQIRDEMGQEQAKGFISSVAPAIQQALENLKSTREALASGVRTLTGEEQGAEMLGGEPGDEEMGPVEPDAMNAGEEELGGEDEFAAAEPAAGGLGDAGREQRESIQYQNSLLKVLAG
jgi:hypothetical protein